jgi:hypothetical protein
MVENQQQAGEATQGFDLPIHGYSTALIISSTTFFASPNTIIVLSM